MLVILVGLPETKEVLKDGWFYTGILDTGEMMVPLLYVEEKGIYKCCRVKIFATDKALNSHNDVDSQ